MTCESINWEEEAKRVARAFGVEVPCYFGNESPYSDRMKLGIVGTFRCDIHEHVIDVRLPDFKKLSVIYEPDRRHFGIVRFPVAKAFVSIGVKGDLIGTSLVHSHYLADLAKGLFQLDLYTAQIDEIFRQKGTENLITAHQKLEWELEYAERWGEKVE